MAESCLSRIVQLLFIRNEEKRDRLLFKQGQGLSEGKEEKGQVYTFGVPSEGYCFLTGESPVMVKTRAM